MFDLLADRWGLRPGARVVEIGPGTGQHETVRWEGEHDPAGLRRIFATFAAWIDLDAPLREELLDCVERLAREEFGGVVRRSYLTVVHAARRRTRV